MWRLEIEQLPGFQGLSWGVIGTKFVLGWRSSLVDAERSSSGRCDSLGGEVGIGCAGGELCLGKRPEGNMRWD